MAIPAKEKSGLRVEVTAQGFPFSQRISLREDSVWYVGDREFHDITVRILDVKETAIRSALIALGWTPPAAEGTAYDDARTTPGPNAVLKVIEDILPRQVVQDLSGQIWWRWINPEQGLFFWTKGDPR